MTALDMLASDNVLYAQEIKCKCKTLNNVVVRDCRHEARPPRSSDHKIVYQARDSKQESRL